MMEKIKKGKQLQNEMVRMLFKLRMISKDFFALVTFEQRSKLSERESHESIWGRRRQ